MTRACAFWEGARYQSDVVVPPIVTTLSVPLASLAPAHAHARPGAGELGQDRRPRVPGRDGRNSERNEGNSSLLTEPKRKAISTRRMALFGLVSGACPYMLIKPQRVIPSARCRGFTG